jgi:hypothetical protein
MDENRFRFSSIYRKVCCFSAPWGKLAPVFVSFSSVGISAFLDRNETRKRKGAIVAGYFGKITV